MNFSYNKFSEFSKNLTFSILSSFLYLLVLLFTPRIFSLIEPDSGGYIDFSNIRSSFYPSIINLFEFIDISLQILIIFHIFVFLISLTYFIYQLLKFKLNKFIIFLIYLSLLLNIYYNGFHFTILTESLSFSIILLLCGNLINFFHSKSKTVIVNIVFNVSLLLCLKPATTPIFVVILLTVLLNLWFEKKLKMTFFFKFIFLPIFIIISLENYLFYSNHQEKKTVLERHFFGKSIMIKLLSYQENSLIDELPNNNTYDFIKKADSYLENLSGFYGTCLKLERYGDFENYSYFYLVNEKYLNSIESKNFVKKTFSNNINFYIKLTGLHYLNFFCVATPTKYGFYIDKPPLIPKDTFDKNYRINIIYFSFLGLGITFIFTNIMYLFFFLRNLIVKKKIFDQIDKLNITLIFTIQSYLITVAGLTISNPRYLMLVFPLIVFVSLTTLYKIVRDFTKMTN